MSYAQYTQMHYNVEKLWLYIEFLKIYFISLVLKLFLRDSLE